MGNLLEGLYSYKDRVFINNEKTKNFIQNNPEIKNILEKSTIENKNLLIKKSARKDMNDLYYHLMLMAAFSFKKEWSLYRKIEGKEHTFSNAIKKAYETKDYKYLTQPYGKGSTLGKALTNLFYGSDADNLDSGMTQFIIEMAHLNTHQFIEDMEVSNINIVTNLFYNKIENFFQEAKYEKNLALETNSDNAIEIFNNVYNEKTIFDILQKKKNKITEKEVAKLFPKEMNQIIAEARNSGENSAIVRKKVQEGNIDLTNKYNEIVQLVISSIKTALTQELQNITIEGITIEQLILEILSDKNIVEVKRSGAYRQGDGFTLASFTINTQKLREKIAKYVVENNKKDDQNEGILKRITETDARNIMNEGVKAILIQYNNALYNYLVGKRTNQLAWDYYENNLLSEVTRLTLRDWEDSVKPSPVSELYQEIEKANRASIRAAEWNKSIKQLEDLEKRITQTNTLSQADEAQIEQIVSKFDKINEKDSGMLEELKSAFSKGNYSQGVKILKDRLKSKRAGYIANFNGSIGEIFITTILNKIAPKGFDVYQKGSTKNLQGQSAHADITLGDIGIQSKVYQKNDIKLYPDTKVTFESQDALRYLNTTTNIKGKVIDESELQAFRFFLLNNTILEEIGIMDWSDNDFMTALNLRLANFIRYSDGLTDLENIKNNFFIINFNIVPASVIFLKMADLFKDERTYSNTLIDFFNNTNHAKLDQYSPSTQDSSNYLIKNLLSYLSKSYALFKGFELNMSDLGTEIF